jgi:hypothetical protein
MRSTERGATAVIVAIVLAVLCGFVALSLDVGHLLSVRGELQNGADAAAMAGAKRLNGTNLDSELAKARAEAENYARNHPTDIYDVEPTTIELGAWVGGTDCPDGSGPPSAQQDGYSFCPISGNTEQDAANVKAVRVVTKRTGTPGATGGGEVPLAFGSFVGKSQQEVSAEAIAVTGGPCGQGCPDLPIAIRAGCLYDNGALRCDNDGIGDIYYIGFSPAPRDSAGLTSLSSKVSANANAACKILQRPDDCNIPLSDQESINIQNGKDVVSACDPGCVYKKGELKPDTKNDTVCEVIRKKADTDCNGEVDDANGDGRPDYTAQIPVVLYEGETVDTCSPQDQYNQQATVVGWATVGIVSVRCERADDLPFGAKQITAICDDYILKNFEKPENESVCIVIQPFCDEEDDESARVGCGWYGTSPLQAVLVR